MDPRQATVLIVGRGPRGLAQETAWRALMGPGAADDHVTCIGGPPAGIHPRDHIREHIRLAKGLADKVAADPRFQLVAPAPFGLVVFRHVDGNAATSALATALNDSGKVAVTPTTLGEVTALRVSIGQTNTAADHVDQLWSMIDELA